MFSSLVESVYSCVVGVWFVWAAVSRSRGALNLQVCVCVCVQGGRDMCVRLAGLARDMKTRRALALVGREQPVTGLPVATGR